MWDGHIKRTQWCHLARKRKVQNVYSVDWPHFLCGVGKMRKFLYTPQREDLGEAKCRGFGRGPAPYDTRQRASSPNTLGRLLKIVCHYMAETQNTSAKTEMNQRHLGIIEYWPHNGPAGPQSNLLLMPVEQRTARQRRDLATEKPQGQRKDMDLSILFSHHGDRTRDVA